MYSLVRTYVKRLRQTLVNLLSVINQSHVCIINVENSDIKHLKYTKSLFKGQNIMLVLYACLLCCFSEHIYSSLLEIMCTI